MVPRVEGRGSSASSHPSPVFKRMRSFSASSMALDPFIRSPLHSIFRPMQSILLIDHGSVRAEANQMLAEVGELLQQMVGSDVLVRYAHMELAEPSIEQG